MSEMTDQEITELAAILINDHGYAALDVARRRRDQHARDSGSDAYRLWARITDATARILRTRQLESSRQDA